MKQIDQDYLWLTHSRGSRPLAYWLLLASFLPIMIGTLAFVLHGWLGPTATANNPMSSEQRALRQPQPAPATAPPPGNEQRVLIAKAAAAIDEPERADDITAVPHPAPPQWNAVPIESGDTLALAFERHGLLYDDSLSIVRLPEYGWRFARGLRAGAVLQVQKDARGHVTALNYPLDKLREIQVREAADGYKAELVELEVERRIAYSVGEITSSFYASGLDAGLSDNVIMNLADIFAWDIDFAMDISPGDRFVVIYEELYRDGKKIKDGNILATEFNNRGRAYRAIRYSTDGKKAAYFTPEGKALKKAFLRTPLDQFRISSHFSLGRKHPILNRIRKHAGTDYAAPTGTPIKAAGDGVVVHRGKKGGYGNLLEIRHNKRITTRYGHLSRFATGIHNGSKVRQGQIVGYVGMTGLATGPHLHYEFREFGQPKNPQTVALPKAEPLPATHRDKFKNYSDDLLVQIGALSRIQLAYAGADKNR